MYYLSPFQHDKHLIYLILIRQTFDARLLFMFKILKISKFLKFISNKASQSFSPLMATEKKPIIEVESPILKISCSEEFPQLTKTEQLYSYYFYKAAWEGAKICYFQRSFESPALFCLFSLIFREPIELFKKRVLENGLTEQEFKKFLVYVAAVFTNCGNYKSFGDTKFVPDLSEETFEKLIKLSKAYEINMEIIDEIWKSIKTHVFRYDGLYKKIG